MLHDSNIVTQGTSTSSFLGIKSWELLPLFPCYQNPHFVLGSNMPRPQKWGPGVSQSLLFWSLIPDNTHFLSLPCGWGWLFDTVPTNEIQREGWWVASLIKGETPVSTAFFPACSTGGRLFLEQQQPSCEQTVQEWAMQTGMRELPHQPQNHSSPWDSEIPLLFKPFSSWPLLPAAENTLVVEQLDGRERKKAEADASQLQHLDPSDLLFFLLRFLLLPAFPHLVVCVSLITWPRVFFKNFCSA